MTKILINEMMDDLVDLWHCSNSGYQIWEFIGIAKDDYFKWVVNPNYPLELEYGSISGLLNKEEYKLGVDNE